MNIYPSEVVEQSGTHNIIVCEENKRVFRLENKSKRFIQKIKVDGGLIKEGVRCNYAIDANEDSTSDSSSDKIYLIELKGSDKDHACLQIIQTLKFFQERYTTNSYQGRIVLSKDHAPNILTTNQKRLIQLEKQKKINLLIKSQIIEEVL